MPKIQGQSLAEHRERTRSALFSSLSDLMAHRPFEKITLSDVAAHAHVGRTAVYNHFADKEALLLAFMERETEQYARDLARALEVTNDPIDRLRLYVREQALLRRYYHVPTGSALAHVVSRETAHKLRSHGELMEHMLTVILTDAMEQGLIIRQNPHTLVTLIHACVLGGRATPLDDADCADYLQALDSFVLRAVGAEVPTHELPEVHSPRPTHRPYIDRLPAAGRCPVAG